MPRGPLRVHQRGDVLLRAEEAEAAVAAEHRECRRRRPGLATDREAILPLPILVDMENPYKDRK